MIIGCSGGAMMSIINNGAMDFYLTAPKPNPKIFELMKLILTGTLSEIETFIKQHFQSDIPVLSNQTAIKYTLVHNRLDVTEMLITKFNMDVDKISYSETETPLTYACKYNNMPAIQMLLSHNANPHLEDRNGYSAFTYVIIKNDFEVLSQLINSPKFNPELLTRELIYAGTQLMVDYLVEKGANFNKLFDNYNNKFAKLCQEDNVNRVKFIIEQMKKYDVNMSYFLTFYIYIATGNTFDVLLENGVDLNVGDPSYMEYIVDEEHLESLTVGRLRYLMEKGGKITPEVQRSFIYAIDYHESEFGACGFYRSLMENEEIKEIAQVIFEDISESDDRIKEFVEKYRLHSK